MEAVEVSAESAHKINEIDNTYKIRYAKTSLTSADTADTSYMDYLESNSHFFNTPVNVSYSSVHVPTYVYDQSKSVYTCTIVLYNQWSK